MVASKEKLKKCFLFCFVFLLLFHKEVSLPCFEPAGVCFWFMQVYNNQKGLLIVIQTNKEAIWAWGLVIARFSLDKTKLNLISPLSQRKQDWTELIVMLIYAEDFTLLAQLYKQGAQVFMNKVIKP